MFMDGQMCVSLYLQTFVQLSFQRKVPAASVASDNLHDHQNDHRVSLRVFYFMLHMSGFS